MIKIILIKYSKFTAIVVVIVGVGSLVGQHSSVFTTASSDQHSLAINTEKVSRKSTGDTYLKNDKSSMPIYGNWRNFTSKDGLPGDKTYCNILLNMCSG